MTTLLLAGGLVACFAWAVVASAAAMEWKRAFYAAADYWETGPHADARAEAVAWAGVRAAEARVREQGRRAEELRRR